jgi:transcriptional regulator with XRE-family HTH domain
MTARRLVRKVPYYVVALCRALEGAIMLDITIYGARIEAGLTQDQVAALAGVSRRTIIRWERDNSGPPMLRLYLQSVKRGNLVPDEDDTAWYDWKFVREGKRYKLCSPAGLSFYPSEIAGIPQTKTWLREAHEALERERAKEREKDTTRAERAMIRGFRFCLMGED